jgi:hypothetical protein
MPDGNPTRHARFHKSWCGINVTLITSSDPRGMARFVQVLRQGRNMDRQLKLALFSVKPESYGWIAYAEGRPDERQFFASKSLALTYAQLWAEANRPSKLRLLDHQGALTREWSYEPLMA